MTTAQDQSRADFEAAIAALRNSPYQSTWRSILGISVSIGDYLDPLTRRDWALWKAARALPQGAEAFGYWHQGPTDDESEFFLHADSGDVSCENCTKLYTASQVPAMGRVPPQWQAVPVEPDAAMWKAARSVPKPNPPYPAHYALVWAAMLAAAPRPPAAQERKPLTHEQIVEIDEQALRDVHKRPRRGYCELFARGVEAAHGIVGKEK